MIVDCFTHTWEAGDPVGRLGPPDLSPADSADSTAMANFAGQTSHLASTDPVDVTLVLGFVSQYLEAEIPNDRVAAYVRQYPDRLIGLAGVDPSDPKEAIRELKRAREELSMPGVAVAPAAQDFHPTNSQAMLVYAAAAELGMPIIFHTGIHLTAGTKLEYARPLLLDEIARELPDLKIVIAHVGYPWVAETLLLLAKHENVYAEISGLMDQPWEGYQALLSADQHGVMDKLLFGSGFPGSSAACAIEDLYSINHLCKGINLPAIPREHLRGIVERDTLALLGIARPPGVADLQPAAATTEEEEI